MFGACLREKGERRKSDHFLKKEQSIVRQPPAALHLYERNASNFPENSLRTSFAPHRLSNTRICAAHILPFSPQGGAQNVLKQH